MHGHNYIMQIRHIHTMSYINRKPLIARKSKSIDNLLCTRMFSAEMDICIVVEFNINLHYSSDSFLIKSIFQKCILSAFAMYTDH